MFDVGGVLLSNGWDRGHREAAAEMFDLDLNDFQDRHEMVVDLLETGRMTAFSIIWNRVRDTSVP
jgi:putative hydrolase of the HAD superfamily